MGSAQRLPARIDPDVLLVGHFLCEDGECWVSHFPRATVMELDGCFNAAELRRFVEVLEGRHG